MVHVRLTDAECAATLDALSVTILILRSEGIEDKHITKYLAARSTLTGASHVDAAYTLPTTTLSADGHTFETQFHSFKD
jgi:hypothetical protein